MECTSICIFKRGFVYRVYKEPQWIKKRKTTGFFFNEQKISTDTSLKKISNGL